MVHIVYMAAYSISQINAALIYMLKMTRHKHKCCLQINAHCCSMFHFLLKHVCGTVAKHHFHTSTPEYNQGAYEAEA